MEQNFNILVKIGKFLDPKKSFTTLIDTTLIMATRRCDAKRRKEEVFYEYWKVFSRERNTMQGNAVQILLYFRCCCCYSFYHFCDNFFSFPCVPYFCNTVGQRSPKKSHFEIFSQFRLSNLAGIFAFSNEMRLFW